MTSIQLSYRILFVGVYFPGFHEDSVEITLVEHQI